MTSLFTYVAATAGFTILSGLTTTATAATFVNTELVLSIDVSGSIDSHEFWLQRSSYANVFRDPGVINLIESLDNGIAVTVQYWASQPGDTLPWHHITNAQDAFAFADIIETTPRPFEGLTNIAGALHAARHAISDNQFLSERQVIDISSDGRQNTQTMIVDPFSTTDLCAPLITPWTVSNNDLADSCLNHVHDARDAAVADGITINGLPILTEHNNLSSYFVDNVIGGQDAFVQPAASFSDFQQAILAKVRQEIEIAMPTPTPIAIPVPTPIPAPSPTVSSPIPNASLPVTPIVNDPANQASTSVPEPDMKLIFSLTALAGHYLRIRN